jgi:hypothetical protein
LWWSNGKRDDLFWRTGGSGGRAKRRGRAGQKTHGQHGDICATHPKAQLLIDTLTIEIKRGYNRCTFADVMDKTETAAIQQWESWVLQAEESYQQAGSKSWMIIHKRDRRMPMVYVPAVFYRHLKAAWFLDAQALLRDATCPLMILCFNIGRTEHVVMGMPLESFLSTFTPKMIREGM